MCEFCNHGKVVGTKDVQITRLTGDHFYGKTERSGLTGITPLMCFPEFPQGSLAHPGEWLFSQVTLTSFVLPTNYSPGGIISDSSEIQPQRGEGNYQDVSHK